MKLFIIFCLNFALDQAVCIEKEVQIISDLMNHLSIRRCWLIHDKIDGFTWSAVRNLTKKYIFTTAVEYNNLKMIFKGKQNTSLELVAVSSNAPNAYIQLMQLLRQNSISKESSRFVWLIFPCHMFASKFRTYVRFDTMFLVICHASNDWFYIYRVTTLRMKWRYDGFAVWEQKIGLNTKVHRESLYNLNGITLNLLRETTGECVSSAECVHLELWNTMGQWLNFSTNIVTGKSNRSIMVDASTEATVYHSNAMSKDPFLIDSMAPIWQYAVYLFIKFENDSFKASSFSMPFSSMTWLAVLGCLSLTVICSVLSSYFDNSGILSCSLMAPFVASDCISNQCGDEIGRSPSRRIIILFTRFMAILVVPAYTASIKSILTYRHPVYPFTDLNSFIDDGTFKITARSDTFMVGYFEYSNNPVVKLIYEKYFEDYSLLPYTTGEGVAKVCKQKRALLTLEELIDENSPCKLLKIPKPVFTTFAGMRLSRNSEFKKIFFAFLLKSYTSGILKRLIHEHKMEEIEEPEVTSFNISQILPLFYLIIIGVCTSIAILWMEINYYKYRVSCRINFRKSDEGKKVFRYLKDESFFLP